MMFLNSQYHPPINHIADTELLCAVYTWHQESSYFWNAYYIAVYYINLFKS